LTASVGKPTHTVDPPVNDVSASALHNPVDHSSSDESSINTRVQNFTGKLVPEELVKLTSVGQAAAEAAAKAGADAGAVAGAGLMSLCCPVRRHTMPSPRGA
jgi:hypothetical protein